MKWYEKNVVLLFVFSCVTYSANWNYAKPGMLSTRIFAVEVNDSNHCTPVLGAVETANHFRDRMASNINTYLKITSMTNVSTNNQVVPDYWMSDGPYGVNNYDIIFFIGHGPGHQLNVSRPDYNGNPVWNIYLDFPKEGTITKLGYYRNRAKWLISYSCKSMWMATDYSVSYVSCMATFQGLHAMVGFTSLSYVFSRHCVGRNNPCFKWDRAAYEGMEDFSNLWVKEGKSIWEAWNTSMATLWRYQTNTSGVEISGFGVVGTLVNPSATFYGLDEGIRGTLTSSTTFGSNTPMDFHTYTINDRQIISTYWSPQRIEKRTRIVGVPEYSVW